MDESSYSYKTLRNSLYLFANFLLPMAFGIFVARGMADRLGDGEFGIFLLISSISAFVNFIDLDFGAAVTKYAAEYHGAGNHTGLRELLSSARILFVFTGILGLLVFMALGKWFLPVFHITESSQPHIFVVFALAGMVFLLNSLNTVYAVILQAMQRFDLIAKLGMASMIVTSLGTLILLYLDLRLKAIMALQVLVGFGLLLAYRHWARKLLPNLRLNFVLVKLEVKKAYKFGLQTFVSNISSTALIYLDRLLIPIMLGPAFLPFYSVPGNVATKTAMVTNSLGGMFFPMASAFQGSGEMDKLKTIYIRAFRNLHIVAAAVTVAIFMFADKILLFWLGQKYADQSAGILKILALTYFVVALYIPLQSILLGLGKVKFLIRQSLVMAGINFALLLILVPRYGIKGAALAYLIAIAPMPYAFYWAERHLFNITGQLRMYAGLYARLIFTALLCVILIKVFLLGMVKGVLTLAIIGPGSIMLYFLLYYIFGFAKKEDIDIFKAFFLKFFKLKS